MPNESGSHRFLYLPHWHFPGKLPGLTGLYLNAIFRTLAFSLTGIFIPVFVYKISGWNGLLGFFLLRQLVVIGLTIPAGFFIKKLGPDIPVALAAGTLFLTFIFLIQAESNPSLIYWAAFFWGVTIQTHWIPYHLAFSWESDRQKLQHQVANRETVFKLAAAASPLLGGIIATVYGFAALYLASGIILLLSIVPIFLDQYNKKENHFSLKRLKETFGRKKLRPFWQGYFGWGMESAVFSFLVPIFLYQRFNGNLEEIGLLATISLLTVLVVLQYLGRSKEKRKEKFFRFGLIASLPNWLIRPFLFSFPFLTLLDSLYQVTALFLWVPVGTAAYRLGKKEGLSFFTARGLMIQLGILTTIILTGLIKSLGLDWRSLFLAAPLGLMIASSFHHGLKKT